MAGHSAVLRASIGALALVAAVARAQGTAATEKFSFEVRRAYERGAAVSGELRIPASARERLPAVLILHSSPGFDGRGAFYAEALDRAGMATIEIDYLQGKGMPASPRHNLPHVYQTLQHLAAHPRIDPSRIGVLGFSWGGVLSLLTSSDELTREYAGGLRFAAHLGLYPICWRHRQLLAGTPWKDLKPSVYERVTGAPVHILAGERDGYDDDPDSCPSFIAALPAQVRAHFSHTVFPGATFGWDSRFSSASYDLGGKQGKGAIVNVVADSATAGRSRDFAVAFFTKAFVRE